MVRTLFGSGRACAIVIASGIFLFTSCQKSVDLTLPEETSVTELKSFLAASSGYAEEKVIYSATQQLFTIDKDVEMTLAEAKDHFNASKTTQSPDNVAGRVMQMKFTYTVSPGKAIAIKIFTESSVPTTWVQAMDSAIKNWNASGSLLRLQRVTQSKKANISVGTIYLENSSTIANSNYPDTYGNAGKRITINTWYNWLEAPRKIFAITHELGHSFGFTHTDGYYGTLINGTPQTDPNSIMNSYVQFWAGFSSYDLIAIRTVYPK